MARILSQEPLAKVTAANNRKIKENARDVLKKRLPLR